MIVRLKDLSNFYGISKSASENMKRTILDSLGLKKTHLTVLDLAQYEGKSVEMIQKALK